MNVLRSGFVAALCAMIAGVGLAAEEKDPAPKNGAAEKPDQEALEKAFAEKLTGSALVGTYTVVGQNNDKPPKGERYELETVKKLRDDYWVFTARIKYGDQDVKVPITLKVLWAGDTPVITLTDLTIPGLGTFTARVLIYGDRYVGTWQHDKVGGHMWGTIENPEAQGPKE
jgi:hypothetical protein